MLQFLCADTLIVANNLLVNDTWNSNTEIINVGYSNTIFNNAYKLIQSNRFHRAGGINGGGGFDFISPSTGTGYSFEQAVDSGWVVNSDGTGSDTSYTSSCKYRRPHSRPHSP